MAQDTTRRGEDNQYPMVAGVLSVLELNVHNSRFFMSIAGGAIVLVATFITNTPIDTGRAWIVFAALLTFLMSFFSFLEALLGYSHALKLMTFSTGVPSEIAELRKISEQVERLLEGTFDEAKKIKVEHLLGIQKARMEGVSIAQGGYKSIGDSATKNPKAFGSGLFFLTAGVSMMFLYAVALLYGG